MDAQDVAEEELRAALAGRSLVTLDRFTSAGRTCVLGPMPIPASQPRLSVGYYDTWPAAASSGSILAVEQATARRDGRAKHQWFTDLYPRTLAVCRALPARPAFAAWHEHQGLTSIAQQTRGEVLTLPRRVSMALEDKTRLEEFLAGAGVPADIRIAGVTATRAPSYGAITHLLGRRIVVQPALTSGGRGTVFVNSRSEYERAFDGDGPWRIAEFVEGFSSNITVLTVPAGAGCAVYVDQPSHKAVGVSETGIAAAKGAGNDWSQSWPEALVGPLVEAITQLGSHLYTRHGLSGLWGVDVIWAEDRVAINEINVRNQGTTEVSGVNQIMRGLPPLLVAHLTVMAAGRPTWLPSPEDFNSDTVHRTVAGGWGPFYLKVRNTSRHPVTPGPGWRGPGVYRLGPGGWLGWSRPGAHPMDADLDVDEVLLANGPAPGVVCAPGAELGTVEGLTSRAIFDGASSLSPLGRGLHQAVAALFTPVESEARRP